MIENKKKRRNKSDVFSKLVNNDKDIYIIPGIPPPIPPIPPISGIAGADDLSSGLSVIIASVVVNNAATDTASIKAVLTTLVGSTIPALLSHRTFLTEHQNHKCCLCSL